MTFPSPAAFSSRTVTVGKNLHGSRGFARIAHAVSTSIFAFTFGFLLSPAAISAQARCHRLDVPVPLLLQQVHVSGMLCDSAQGGARTVQVLVPGATYNSSYWSIQYQPSVYSFTDALNRAGYATFALDRLGTGASSKPLGALVTVDLQAFAAHQVIQALRGPTASSNGFSKVILTAHSLGSLVAIVEASRYHDVDGVVLTGIGHHINTVGLTSFLATLYPAPLDPQLADRGLDLGNLTTLPGTRAHSFYAPAMIDPVLAAQDEATKDVLSTGEIPASFYNAYLPSSLGVDAPTFLANGSEDQIACGPLTTGICATAENLLEAESLYFSPGAHLQTYILPGFGHSINYAPNTQDYQKAVVAWSDQHVGH